MGAKPYPAYKDSGVEWIGDIPEHWEVKRTKSVVAIRKVIAGQLGYEVISVTQRGLRLKDTSSFDGQNAQDYSKYQLVNVEDYVLNHMDLLTGYVGKSTYLGVTSPDYRVVRTVDANRTDRKYTLFLFQNCYHHRLWYKYGQGAAHLGRWRLPRQEFNEFQLPSPPLEEQKLIASFLDRETGKIDTLVEKQQQLISLLKEKRQSLISHTVTKGLNPNVRMKDSGVEWIGEIPEHWEVKRLKDVAECRLSNVDKHTVDGEPSVYLCNYVDVYKNDFITSDISFMAATATDRQISRLGIQVDDVLITKDSESPDDIGVPALVRTIVPSLVCGYHLALIRTDGHVQDGAYTFRYLASKSSISQFCVLAKGITRYAIGKGEISRLLIPSPPLEEQKQIAAFLDTETSKIDQLIDKANQSIALLKERRSSLISAAVTGKIDVREAA
jgi:type I restriction enzyme S subunit